MRLLLLPIEIVVASAALAAVLAVLPATLRIEVSTGLSVLGIVALGLWSRRRRR